MSDENRNTPFFPEGKPNINVNTSESNLAGWVAAAYEDQELFKQRGKDAALQLSPEQILRLPKYFFYNNNPRKPEEVRNKFGGLGEWQWICQEAIFEIFYNRPEVALPIIREVAYGVYDWTQAHAIKTLLRLAANGTLEREATLNELAEFFPSMREESQMRTIRYFSLVKPTTVKVIQMLKGLIGENLQYIDEVALDAIQVLAQIAPNKASAYRSLVENFIQSVPKDKATFAHIRSAITLSILYPDDQGLKDKLLDWSQNHPDAHIRRTLNTAFVELPHIKKR